MKKNLLIIIMILLSAFIGYSQAPGIFNYQGVARNSVGNVLANKTISLRLTIHDGSAGGATVYQESRTVTTNPFGLFNVQVGGPGATSATGTIAGVLWGVGAKFIQVEIDPAGGTSFINIGTAQIASVPYSLFATTSGDLVLPFLKTQADAGTLFRINNSGTGISGAIMGVTQSNAANAWGVHGRVDNPAAGGFSTGILGTNLSTTGLGIGVTGSQNGSGWGVYGTTPGGIGVYGLSTSGIGVSGSSNSGTGGLFSSTSGLALNTAGSLRHTGINEGVNKILTSDATGNATWQVPAPATDLVLPFNKTQNETGFLFRLTNSGTTVTSSAIEGVTNSQAANANAIVGTVSSTSPGSRSAAVRGINNGTANLGIGVYGSHAGGGWGVYGSSANGIGVLGNSPTIVGVVGTSTSGDGVNGYSTTGIGVYGTSEAGEAGYFNISDNTNTSDALTGVTGGSGIAVVGNNTGMGSAGLFTVSNLTNNEDVVTSIQSGKGRGVYSSIFNTSNSSAALAAFTNGGGNAVNGVTTGTGHAAVFQVNNSANSSSVMNVITNGTGNGINVQLLNSGNGARGIDVLQAGVGPGVFATSAGGNAVWGITSFVGAAGVIGDNTIGEAVVGRNRGPAGVGAVVGRNDSTGYGVRGFNTRGGIGVLGQAGISGGTGVGGRFENVDTANVSDALQGFTNGRGWAANFINTSNTSESQGIRISTTAGQGGNALTIANGTLVTSYQNSYLPNTVVDDAVLVVRARGTLTIPTGPPLRDGTHIWVVNDSGIAITISNITTGPLNVAAGTAQHLIFVSTVHTTSWIPAQ